MMKLIKELLEAIQPLGKFHWDGTPIQNDIWYVLSYGDIIAQGSSMKDAYDTFVADWYGNDDDDLPSYGDIEEITSKEDVDDIFHDNNHNEVYDIFRSGHFAKVIIRGDLLKMAMARHKTNLMKPGLSNNPGYLGAVSDIAKDIEKHMNGLDLSDFADDEGSDDLKKLINARKAVHFEHKAGTDKAIMVRSNTIQAENLFETMRILLIRLKAAQVAEHKSYGVTRWIGKMKAPKEWSQNNTSQDSYIYCVLEHFDKQVHLTIYPQRLLPNAIQRLLTKR